MPTSEKGVIYCAYGEKYLREATISAKSLRVHNNVEIAIFTDLTEKAEALGVFDYVFSFAPISEFQNEFVAKQRLPSLKLSGFPSRSFEPE